MQVIFRRQDSTVEKTIDVLPDSKLSESREVAQMLLGLPENPPCKLVLERTNKELEDSLTFIEVGIRQNDKLILLSLTEQEIKSSQEVPLHPVSHSPPPLKISPSQTPSILTDWHIVAITSSIIGGFTMFTLAVINSRSTPSDQSPLQSPPEQQSSSISQPKPKDSDRSDWSVNDSDAELSSDQDKFNAKTLHDQIKRGSVLFFDKKGDTFTGQITETEIRESQNPEESGIAVGINWNDGVTSSILFMKNSRVRVWEAGAEYGGYWYWGTDDGLLHVEMDAGSKYQFSE